MDVANKLVNTQLCDQDMTWHSHSVVIYIM